LLDFLKPPIEVLQDFYILSGRALKNVFLPPHYADDIALQMDNIGVGSLPIVILIGFFTGFIIAMQMSRALADYGATDQVGQIVAITLVRELGPVLTAVIVAGRNASGIASELGSMKVTEQIDAMRALGTDPIQKLVTPRMIAMCTMLPCLTVIADFVGLLAGGLLLWPAHFGRNAGCRLGHHQSRRCFHDLGVHRDVTSDARLCEPTLTDVRRKQGFFRGSPEVRGRVAEV
jgi:phospholipid/cholesterol/gamma-HCH transport system permease protein